MSRLLADRSLVARTPGLMVRIDHPDVMEPDRLRAQGVDVAKCQVHRCSDDGKCRAHRCFKAAQEAVRLAVGRGWLA